MKSLFAIFALPVCASIAAETLTGRVVHVSDGDTITVLDGSETQHKIRVAAIDAPENSQAFGERSRESLAEMVAGKTVLVETRKKTDTDGLSARFCSTARTSTWSKSVAAWRGTTRPPSVSKTRETGEHMLTQKLRRGSLARGYGLMRGQFHLGTLDVAKRGNKIRPPGSHLPLLPSLLETIGSRKNVEE